MINIRVLNQEQVKILSAYYMHAQFLFGEGLQYASHWKQKRAKRWFLKHHSDFISALPESAQHYFSFKENCQALFDFLSACWDEVQQINAENMAIQNAALESLSEDVRHTLLAMQDPDRGAFLQCTQDDGSAVLMIDGSVSFVRYLVLKNALLSPELIERGHIYATEKIAKEGNWYILYAQENWVEQEILRFTDAHVRVDCYNSMREEVYWHNSWSLLQMLAWSIYSKSQLPGDYCNDREKELLPLLREMNQFGVLSEYPLLTALAEQTGCKTPAFDRLMAKARKTGYWERVNALSSHEYAPLLRTIYEKIQFSQEEYPIKVEKLCDPNILGQTRTAIQSYMESQGFYGQYPDFVKYGDIPGVHGRESYSKLYFYNNEKDARMHIHCVETWAESKKLSIHFLCGIATKHHKSAVQDIFDCLLNAKGYRWYCWVRDYERCNPMGRNHQEQRILRLAEIAVKTAQLQKLSNEEKQIAGVNSTLFPALFRRWPWLIGGLIGIAIPLAMILITALILLAVGERLEILAFFARTPWSWMLLGGWAIGMIAASITAYFIEQLK